MYFLTVLAAGWFKIKTGQVWFLVRASSWLSDHCFLTVTSYGGDKEIKILVVFIYLAVSDLFLFAACGIFRYSMQALSWGCEI